MDTISCNVHHVIDREKVGLLQWVILGLCGLVMFVDGFDNQTISYVVPVLTREWHLSRSALGPIFSSALAGSVIGYIAIASLSNRYGHKRMMVLQTVIFSIAIFLTVFATSVSQLIPLRFVTGLALGAIVPSTIAIAVEYSPARYRATSVLLIYCCFSLGFVGAGLAAGTLLPRYGWPSLFWVGSIVPLVLLMPMVFVMPESVSFLANRRKDAASVARVMARLYPKLSLGTGVRLVSEQEESARKGVMGLFVGHLALGTALLWVAFFINVAAFYFLQSWLPTMLGNLHYSHESVVWITALTTIGGALSAFVIGPAMDRIGAYTTLGVLYVVGGVLMAAIGGMLSMTPALLMLSTFFAGFCVSGGQKSVIALSAMFYPADLRASGVGWALAIGRIGGMTGPFLVGLLYVSNWQVNEIFYIAAVPLFVAALAILLMGRRYARASGQAAITKHAS